jgi:transposase-like protein
MNIEDIKKDIEKGTVVEVGCPTCGKDSRVEPMEGSNRVYVCKQCGKPFVPK